MRGGQRITHLKFINYNMLSEQLLEFQHGVGKIRGSSYPYRQGLHGAVVLSAWGLSLLASSGLVARA
jgi:hypothetical protein